MRTLALSFSLLAAAVGAGCAMEHSGTGMMGAGPSSSASAERTLYCKDGSYVTKSVGCAGGVERDLTPPASTSAPTQQQDKY
jgi:hypothetical protein